MLAISVKGSLPEAEVLQKLSEKLNCAFCWPGEPQAPGTAERTATLLFRDEASANNALKQLRGLLPEAEISQSPTKVSEIDAFMNMLIMKVMQMFSSL